MLAGELDGGAVLGVVHGRGLAGRAGDDERIRAARNLVVDEARELVVVDAVIGERRDERDAGAGENRLFQRKPSSVSMDVCLASIAFHYVILEMESQ